MFDLITRVLMLPMLILLAAVAVATPLVILAAGVGLFIDPDLNSFFGLLLFLGAWPLILSWVHGVTVPP